jgi:hypothetical protein
MKGILLVIVLAIIVEAFIEYAKSIGKMFTDGDVKTGITQLISIAVAVALCFAAGADLFVALGVDFTWPWIGVVLTGVFGSRGANYVSDLVKRFQNVKGDV